MQGRESHQASWLTIPSIGFLDEVEWQLRLESTNFVQNGGDMFAALAVKLNKRQKVKEKGEGGSFGEGKRGRG